MSVVDALSIAKLWGKYCWAVCRWRDGRVIEVLAKFQTEAEAAECLQKLQNGDPDA